MPSSPPTREPLERQGEGDERCHVEDGEPLGNPVKGRSKETPQLGGVLLPDCNQGSGDGKHARLNKGGMRRDGVKDCIISKCQWKFVQWAMNKMICEQTVDPIICFQWCDVVFSRSTARIFLPVSLGM